MVLGVPFHIVDSVVTTMLVVLGRLFLYGRLKFVVTTIFQVLCMPFYIVDFVETTILVVLCMLFYFSCGLCCKVAKCSR